MLMECAECKREMSDAAPTCVHCGHPNQRITTANVPHVPEPDMTDASLASEPKRFGYLAAAVIVFLLCLFAPFYSSPFGFGACLALAVVSVVNREAYRWGAVAMICFASLFSMRFLNYVYSPPAPTKNESFHPPAAGSSEFTDAFSVKNLSAVKIESWDWNPDPLPGRLGSTRWIKWNVAVKNVSQRPIRTAQITLTTYDKNGKIVATSPAFVMLIPPGEVRTTQGLADCYGIEKTAHVVVSQVFFAQ